jgi:hypothetical protein
MKTLPGEGQALGFTLSLVASQPFSPQYGAEMEGGKYKVRELSNNLVLLEKKYKTSFLSKTKCYSTPPSDPVITRTISGLDAWGSDLNK